MKANQLFSNHLISNDRENTKNTKCTKYPVKKSVIIELPSVSWLLNFFLSLWQFIDIDIYGFTKCLSLLVRMKRIYSLLNKQNSQNPMDNSSQICFGVVSKFLKCYADGVNLLYLDAYISVYRLCKVWAHVSKEFFGSKSSKNRLWSQQRISEVFSYLCQNL